LTSSPSPSPSASVTPAPDSTATFPSSSLPTPEGSPIQIDLVEKITEYVYIYNYGDQPQDLEGWVLVSDLGEESCSLSGVLQPGEGILIWALAADAAEDGYNCGFESEIWDDEAVDTAILYDADGNLVDQYP
jgi:hypothetical protein